MKRNWNASADRQSFSLFERCLLNSNLDNFIDDDVDDDDNVCARTAVASVYLSYCRKK